MRINRRWLAVVATLYLPLLAGNAHADARYRWDIVRLSLTGTTITINAGGMASAQANDGSMITLTGSGTFTVGDDDVTGGGSWRTVAPDGITVTGTGTYIVTGLVHFRVAPSGPASGLIDNIGPLSEIRGGLVHLRIAYDDGATGILEVSCHVPGNPPPPETVFEGVTASKGFVGFWNRAAPAGTPSTANANRTAFHRLPEAED